MLESSEHARRQGGCSPPPRLLLENLFPAKGEGAPWSGARSAVKTGREGDFKPGAVALRKEGCEEKGQRERAEETKAESS